MVTSRSGSFIAIESTSYQRARQAIDYLDRRLSEAGHQVFQCHFPSDKPSSYLPAQYAEGKYGKQDAVSPYAASLFYALDRFNLGEKINAELESGGVVLATGCVGSTMAKEGSKFQRPEERRGYFIWIDNMEYLTLGSPRPDKTFVLFTVAENKQKRASSDVVEDKRGHKTEELLGAYDDLCQLFPRDYTKLDFVRGNKLIAEDTANDLLWKSVSSLLPPPSQNKINTAPPNSIEVTSYFIPENLDKTTREYYVQTIDRILEIRREASSILENSHNDMSEVSHAINSLLPIAAKSVLASEQHAFAKHDKLKDAVSILPAHFSDEAAETAVLQDAWPRNEMSALPALLYPHSALPLATLQQEADKWTYDQKSAALHAAAKYALETDSASSIARYTWDLLTDCDTYAAFMEAGVFAANNHQPLSPRYGYGLPDIVEQESLVDMFETCYDLSLKLYSKLQAGGFGSDAPCAMLLGHRVRWTVSCDISELINITSKLAAAPLDHQGLRKIAAAMCEKVSEVHPMLAEVMKALNQDENTGLSRLTAERYTQSKLQRMEKS